jgi:hypothetical protein
VTGRSVELEQEGAAETVQAPQVADDRLIAMPVDRARSDGLRLTGGGRAGREPAGPRGHGRHSLEGRLAPATHRPANSQGRPSS